MDRLLQRVQVWSEWVEILGMRTAVLPKSASGSQQRATPSRNVGVTPAGIGRGYDLNISCDLNAFKEVFLRLHTNPALEELQQIHRDSEVGQIPTLSTATPSVSLHGKPTPRLNFITSPLPSLSISREYQLAQSKPIRLFSKHSIDPQTQRHIHQEYCHFVFPAVVSNMEDKNGPMERDIAVSQPLKRLTSTASENGLLQLGNTRVVSVWGTWD
ncbi:hypothetical protein BD779DRAFT_1475067 [Infundibulicybe gibba]|nr:hypothetical protein BD779DRAFT_1475067 [Infundibulicybe gibba]